MKMPRVNLEQWSTLVAVVEEGSFHKAAEALNKSQSAVSYAIARLEEQLPTPALKQEGRRATLTEAGEVLYRRAKQLLEHANELELTAKCLAEGWASELVIAVESIVPMEWVLKAISLFSEQAPQTRIVLLETTLSGTEETLFERRADLVLCANIPTGFIASEVGEVAMIPVAAVNHPLLNSSHPLNEKDLHSNRQIVVRDSGQKRTQDKGWLQAEQRLTVSHFSSAIKAVELGLGFCFIPQQFIARQLEGGTLQQIPLSQVTERSVPIFLVTPSSDDMGPAARAMIDCLKIAFKP